MRMYIDYHPTQPMHVAADRFDRDDGTCFVRVAISDVPPGTMNIYLDSLDALIALGRQIEAEGIRLQASNPIPPADPDEDDDDESTPLQPASVATEEVALPL